MIELSKAARGMMGAWPITKRPPDPLGAARFSLGWIGADAYSGGWLMSAGIVSVITIGLLLPWALLAFAAWKLWPRVRALLERPTLPPRAPESFAYQQIEEDPLPKGKLALDFWGRIHRTPDWRVLQHHHQSNCRDYLREAKDAAEKGNQTGALFYLGRAHEAAFWAVRPEHKILQITKALLAERQEQKREATETGEPASDGERRPGSRWPGIQGA